MCAFVTAAAVLALSGPAAAEHKKTAAKDKPVKCPVCKMTMSTKKTKETPKMVKVGGKTLYCCAACEMDKKGHKDHKGHDEHKAK